MNKPCEYCGHVAPRLSDEDCPAHPNRPPTEREALDAMQEALREVVTHLENAARSRTIPEDWQRVELQARAALALAEKVSQ